MKIRTFNEFLNENSNDDTIETFSSCIDYIDAIIQIVNFTGYEDEDPTVSDEFESIFHWNIEEQSYEPVLTSTGTDLLDFLHIIDEYKYYSYEDDEYDYGDQDKKLDEKYPPVKGKAGSIVKDRIFDTELYKKEWFENFGKILNNISVLEISMIDKILEESLLTHPTSYTNVAKMKIEYDDMYDIVMKALIEQYKTLKPKTFASAYNFLPPEKQKAIKKYQMLNKYKNVI